MRGNVAHLSRDDEDKNNNGDLVGESRFLRLWPDFSTS